MGRREPNPSRFVRHLKNHAVRDSTNHIESDNRVWIDEEKLIFDTLDRIDAPMLDSRPRHGLTVFGL